ncbi:MAG: glycoside hydrolase family 2 protein [Ilumatobacteraceae bacterium]
MEWSSDWSIAATPAGAAADPQALAAVAGVWTPAQVPGTVAAALRDAGRWGLDDRADFDADDWWWRARRTGPAGPAVLRFGGLATIAEVWLNGTLLLRSDSMFAVHEVPVALTGDDELVIACRSLNAHLAARRPRGRWRTRLVEQQQLRWVRATFLGRMASWNPVCAPVGPWRPVEVLPAASGLRVERLLASVIDGVPTVEFRAGWRGAVPSAAVLTVGEVQVPLTILPAGDDTALAGAVAVPGAPRWFPATHGEPALLDARLEVTTGDANTVHPLGSLGFRTVEAATEAGGFRLSVNGVPVFCRGACWTPTDLVRLWDHPDRLRAAVQQVADAGFNMLRLAGTGVYEQQEFYDLCDELGVMVWHDAMFANLDQPLDDPAYRATVDAELAGWLIAMQRHPSVVVVCGGSEVEQQAAMMGVPPEAGRNRVGRELLPAAAAELLPGVPVVACSPSGGVFPFHTDEGISHYYGVGAYRRPLGDARTSGVRFTTECLAFANVPSNETVASILGEGDRPGHSPAWKRRVPRDRGAGWDFEDVRDHYVATLFGVDPSHVRAADPDRYLDLGRAAVVAAIETTLTEFRRPGSSCDGALVYLLRDPWPAAGWGLVDDAGRPKSAFRATARACRPRTVLLRDEGLNGVRATVYNDLPTALAGSLQFRLFDADGSLMDSAELDLALDGRASRDVSVDGTFGHFRDLAYAYRFGPQQVDVIAATLRDDAGTAVTSALLPGGHDRPTLPDLGLQAEVAPVGDAWALTVRAERFAHYVTIDIPGAVADDDWFHLLPGDARTIMVRPLPGALPRSGEVRALNSRRACVVRLDRGAM